MVPTHRRGGQARIRFRRLSGPVRHNSLTRNPSSTEVRIYHGLQQKDPLSKINGVLGRIHNVRSRSGAVLLCQVIRVPETVWQSLRASRCCCRFCHYAFAPIRFAAPWIASFRLVLLAGQRDQTQFTIAATLRGYPTIAMRKLVISGRDVAAPLHKPRPAESESQPHNAKNCDVSGGNVCAPPSHEPGPEQAHAYGDEDSFHLRLLSVCRGAAETGSTLNTLSGLFVRSLSPFLWSTVPLDRSRPPAKGTPLPQHGCNSMIATGVCRAQTISLFCRSMRCSDSDLRRERGG